MAQRSRGRGNPDREDFLKLCSDDRRKLYGLLDGDIASRIRRIEIGMAALLVIGGGQTYSQIKGTSIQAILMAAIHLIF